MLCLILREAFFRFQREFLNFAGIERRIYEAQENYLQLYFLMYNNI